MPGRPLSDDAKSILLKVYKFLGEEKRRGKLLHSIDKPCRRFKVMTGYDWTTAQNIDKIQKKLLRKERSKKPVLNVACVPGVREGPSHSSLVKTGPKAYLDSFDLAVVRRAIHTMYSQGMSVSVPALQKWLSIHHSDINDNISEATLRRGVLRLGFRYQRGMPSKRFRGKEEASVVAARIRYGFISIKS